MRCTQRSSDNLSGYSQENQCFFKVLSSLIPGSGNLEKAKSEAHACSDGNVAEFNSKVRGSLSQDEDAPVFILRLANKNSNYTHTHTHMLFCLTPGAQMEPEYEKNGLEVHAQECIRPA